MDEFGAKDLREGFYREKETLMSRDPSLTVKGECAAGNEAVEVEMIEKGLVPCMQNTGEADFSAEAVVRVGAKLHQCF